MKIHYTRPVSENTSVSSRKDNVFYKYARIFVTAAALAVSVFPYNAESKDDVAKANSASMEGKYACEITKGKGFLPASKTIIGICKDDSGKLDIMAPGGWAEIKKDKKNKFSFQINGDFGTKTPGWIANNGNGSITVSYKPKFFGKVFPIEFSCNYAAPCKSEEPVKSKAVFIRPCEGQFYQSFPKNEDEKAVTNVADGTVEGACKDLKESGVTDVFLPFKADHEGKGCGNYGDLLYNSTNYPGRISERFKDAYSAKFDPIKALMDSESCKDIKFHAWFPVFLDRNAAKIGGQKAYYKRELIEGAVEAVVDLARKDKSDCQSDKFADPSNPTVVEYEMELLEAIVRDYPKLAGINLDYIRYSDDVGGKCKDSDADDAPKVGAWIVDPSAVESFVKKVREKFPNLKLSADVKASSSARLSVGQDGILKYLDIVMPMEYTYFGGFQGSDEVLKWINELRANQPQKQIVPTLRGWKCTQDDGTNHTLCSRTETAEQFKGNLKDSIQVTDKKANGYAIFTYDNLLNDIGEEYLKKLILK